MSITLFISVSYCVSLPLCLFICVSHGTTQCLLKCLVPLCVSHSTAQCLSLCLWVSPTAPLLVSHSTAQCLWLHQSICVSRCTTKLSLTVYLTVSISISYYVTWSASLTVPHSVSYCVWCVSCLIFLFFFRNSSHLNIYRSFSLYLSIPGSCLYRGRGYFMMSGQLVLLQNRSLDLHSLTSLPPFLSIV